jgi:hypothetical protein
MASPHWYCWLGVENQCAVQNLLKNEILPEGMRPQGWFAFDVTRTLAFSEGHLDLPDGSSIGR